MIDPEFWSDEEIGSWSFPARLFYIALWNFADDEGRFKAHNNLLKAQIFPYDTKIDIDKLKKELNNKIQWYKVEKLQYGYIRNFLTYQKIDHPSDSKLPIPPPFAEPSPNLHRTIPLNIREVNIIEDKVPLCSDESELQIPFQEFCKQVIDFLNIKTSRHYEYTSKTVQQLLRARYNEKRTIADCRLVIVHKKIQWANDDKMNQFIRPSTLFRATHFEEYLAEAKQQLEQEKNKGLEND